MDFDSKKFKNIIFDLGGVLLNIDTSLMIKAFSDFGAKNVSIFRTEEKLTSIFDDYEKGAFSSAEFRNKLKTLLLLDISDQEFDAAWNAMLLDLPQQRLDILAQTNRSHRTFLLSNTNEIHINCFESYLIKNFAIKNLDDYFEKVYYSYKVKKRKPDAEIFKMVLNENNLLAEETVFIDDSLQHIEGANKVGIKSYWLDLKNQTLTDLFVNLK